MPAVPTALQTGFVHQALGQDFASLAAAEIYVYGPPPMVESVKKLAQERGAAAEHIHADASHAAPPEPVRMVDQLLVFFRRRA